jgi:hypothetical protein
MRLIRLELFVIGLAYEVVTMLKIHRTEWINESIIMKTDK